MDDYVNDISRVGVRLIVGSLFGAFAVVAAGAGLVGRVVLPATADLARKGYAAYKRGQIEPWRENGDDEEGGISDEEDLIMGNDAELFK